MSRSYGASCRPISFEPGRQNHELGELCRIGRKIAQPSDAAACRFIPREPRRENYSVHVFVSLAAVGHCRYKKALQARRFYRDVEIGC